MHKRIEEYILSGNCKAFQEILTILNHISDNCTQQNAAGDAIYERYDSHTILAAYKLCGNDFPAAQPCASFD